MALETDAVVTTGRTVVAGVCRRWARLDADWKSVVLALVIVGSIVGFDLTVPP